MANLNETQNYENGIYQLETTDPVVGGPEGVSNTQAKQLANRTAWLKQQIEQLLAEMRALGIDDVAGLIEALQAKSQALREHASDASAHGDYLPRAEIENLIHAADPGADLQQLQRDVNNKADTSHRHSKADVGLGNVPNYGASNSHDSNSATRLATSKALKDGLTALNRITERRHVQTITIGGSTDYLYPVFWQFPRSDFGVGRLEICRHFAWNPGVLSGINRADVLSPAHVASLLLDIEGHGHKWDGDAEYLKVLKYFSRYNKTASHLRHAGYARREKINPNGAALYGAEGTCYTHSGIYLRGGGLDYRISANWPIGLIRLPDEDSATARAMLWEHDNTRWYVQRIPFSELEEPVESRIDELAAQFPASLSASGHQRLPNGLIFQWGRLAVNRHIDEWTYVGNITFPRAFPEAVYSFTTHYAHGAATRRRYGTTFHATALSRTGAGAIYASDTGDDHTRIGTLYWMALGR